MARRRDRSTSNTDGDRASSSLNGRFGRRAWKAEKFVHTESSAMKKRVQEGAVNGLDIGGRWPVKKYRGALEACLSSTGAIR